MKKTLTKPRARTVRAIRTQTATPSATRVTFSIAMVLSLLAVVNLSMAIASMNRGKVLGATTKSAVTYYVDADLGSDTNNGLSATAPWQSLAKVAAAALKPGDTVLLHRGQVWHETLTIMQSGSANAPITIADYGTGAKPLIDGQGKLTFGIYAQEKNYLTIKNLGVTGIAGDTTPSAGVVLFNNNGVTLDSVDVSNTIGLAGIYAYSNRADTGLNNVIKNNTVSGTTGSALARGMNNNGIGIQLWSECPTCGGNVTVSGNRLSDNGAHGIGVFYPKVTVTGNTAFNNGNSGITAANDTAHDTVIEKNTVYGNCGTQDDCFGINLFRVGNNNVVRYNTVYAQHDTINDSSIKANSGYGGNKFGTGGIRFDGGDKTLVSRPEFGPGSDFKAGSGNKVYYNLVRDEYDGIQVFNYSNLEVSNNTVSNSRRAGIFAMADNTSGTPVSISLKNNLLANAGTAPTDGLLSFYNVTGGSDYNLFYPAANAVTFNLNQGTAKTTYTVTTWQALGQDVHSVAADPKFVSASDYHLQAGSGAIAKGTSTGITKDIVGKSVSTPPEIGAYEF